VQLTGLHIAAGAGQVMALYKLVTIGAADVNLEDVWGLTPLDHAVRALSWACAVLLVANGGLNLLYYVV
jgi:ankyrin repeat protein